MGKTTKISMVDRRFERLLVIKQAPGQKIRWICVCDCGNVVTVFGDNLRGGKTKSCGCYKVEVLRKLRTTHGHSGTSTINVWRGMFARCENKRGPAYKYYGGRGIKVCKRWRRFENFLVDMGEKPEGKSLDRINNDGNYTPSNCRWATPEQQANNRRCFGKLSEQQARTIKRSKLPGKVLAKQFSVSQTTISEIRHGKCWKSV